MNDESKAVDLRKLAENNLSFISYKSMQEIDLAENVAQVKDVQNSTANKNLRIPSNVVKASYDDRKDKVELNMTEESKMNQKRPQQYFQ